MPLVWTGGYFLFLGTRWVKSVRYFLPIYPFLCLLAAWALMELWQQRARASEPGRPARPPQAAARALFRGVLSTAIVLLGTLAWAYGFVQAVYLTDNTRVQATLWIIQNIPSSVPGDHRHLSRDRSMPRWARRANFIVGLGAPISLSFTAPASGTLQKVTIPHVPVWRVESRLR